CLAFFLRPSMRTSSIALILVVALAAGAAAGYLIPRAEFVFWAPAVQSEPVPRATPPVRPAVAVEAVEIQPTPLERRLSAVGSLMSEESVMLRPEVAGRIREIGFAE